MENSSGGDPQISVLMPAFPLEALPLSVAEMDQVISSVHPSIDFTRSGAAD
jgi:hypothetical protein